MLRCMKHFYIKYLSDVGMKFTHFPLNGYWLPINQNPEQEPESMMDIHLIYIYFSQQERLVYSLNVTNFKLIILLCSNVN